MYQIAILGSGAVGETLANGFLKKGYSVIRASRNPEKLAEWKNKAGEKAAIGTFNEAAQKGEKIVLAVKGSAAKNALRLAGLENLKNKLIMDATNPISDKPPVNGVLDFFTNLQESLMEILQKQAPEAHFVKVFSCVGNAWMVDPDFGGQKPTMFICGNNEEAKAQVKVILDQFGWEVADMGSVEAARAIEPLCILWCIPGFKDNQWSHAFKLLKQSK